VKQRPPKPVQLVDQHRIKPSQPRICHQAVKPWPGGFSATELVLININQIPPATLDVLLQLADLECIALVDRRNPDVQGRTAWCGAGISAHCLLLAKEMGAAVNGAR
jgi:hypothetical protein